MATQLVEKLTSFFSRNNLRLLISSIIVTILSSVLHIIYLYTPITFILFVSITLSVLFYILKTQKSSFDNYFLWYFISLISLLVIHNSIQSFSIWYLIIPLLVMKRYPNTKGCKIALIILSALIMCGLLYHYFTHTLFDNITFLFQTYCVNLLIILILWKFTNMIKFAISSNAKTKAKMVELKETQACLMRAEKLASLGRLSAGIAHEINNPVGFVSSNTVTLKEYITRFRDILSLYEKNADPAIIEKRKKMLKFDRVLTDIDALLMENLEGLSRITTIVSSLKDFARGEKTSEFALADINDGIRSVILLTKNEWKYSADIHTDFGNIDKIECNINELHQVFLNIIVNASQAIREQKRKEKGLIKIVTSQDTDWVYCKIADDGPGIPKEIHDKIFDQFFTTKEIGIGTGLGLSISYDIINNRHHGFLNFTSEVGKGTEFTIKLPKHKSNG